MVYDHLNDIVWRYVTNWLYIDKKSPFIITCVVLLRSKVEASSGSWRNNSAHPELFELQYTVVIIVVVRIGLVKAIMIWWSAHGNV